MKKRLTQLLSIILALIIITSDISSFAASNMSETSENDVNEEVEDLNEDTENIDQETKDLQVYTPYWDEPTFSNLVVFVDFADTVQEHTYNDESIEKFNGDAENILGMRQLLYDNSNGEIRIENFFPQYDEKENQAETVLLDYSAEYYAENETLLVEEVAEKVNDSEIIGDNIILHYGSDENVLDNLTIVVPCEEKACNDLFVSHYGKYEGEAQIGNDAVGSYNIITETDLCYNQEGYEVIVNVICECLDISVVAENEEELLIEDTDDIEDDIFETEENEDFEQLLLIDEESILAEELIPGFTTPMLDENSEIVTGWSTVDNQKMYFDVNGYAYIGLHQISDNNYIFDEDGKLLIGYVEYEGENYYSDKSGILQSGWIKISNVWKYFDKDNFCEIACDYTDGYWYVLENGNISYFSKKTSLIKNKWQTINKQKYYFDAEGALQKGWFQQGDYWYYGKDDGAVVKGLVKLPYGETEELYYFDSNNRLQVGWKAVSGKVYFFEPSDNPEKCYATNQDIEIAPGWLELENGQVSYVNNSKKIVTGWQTINKQRYYFDTNGILQTGWFEVSKKQYYAEPETTEDGILKGTVVKGLKTIQIEDGEQVVSKTYYFHTSQYYKLTGWQTINKQKYYFDPDGVLQTGWFQQGNYWYYGKEDGTVTQGLVALPYGETEQTYYFDSSNRLQTGWRMVSGKYYFFEPSDSPEKCYATNLELEITPGWLELENGQTSYVSSSKKIVTGWQTIDKQRYYFDANGVLQTGWFEVSKKYYYAEPETTDTGLLKGTIAKGAKEIEGETYVFHKSSYYRLTGWQTVDNQRFYLDADGKAVTDWFEVSKKQYYAEPETTEDGILKGTVVKGLKTIQIEDGEQIVSKTYYFHTSQYYKLTDWQTINNQKYYFDPDGVLQTGWFQQGNYWYYGKEDGTVAQGLVELPYGETERTYYFDSSNRLQTGWRMISGKYYFFEPSDSPEKCYATNLELEITPGWLELENGQTSYVSSSKKIVTGWQTIDKQRYYFDANGVLQTGWFEVSKKYYYAEPETTDTGLLKGTIAKGAKEIEGETYVFHKSSYYRLTGWQTVDNQRFYLDADGKAVTGWFQQSNYWYYGVKATTEDGMLRGSLAKYLTVIICMADDGQETEYKYYFDSNYRLSTGWKTIDKMKYFFNSDENPEKCYMLYSCQPETGWVTFEDGNKSYFNSKGNAVTGWQTISGKKYYFDQSGIMQTGWCLVSGKEYFFNCDGIYMSLNAPVISFVKSNNYRTVDVKWDFVSDIDGYVMEYSTDSTFSEEKTISISIEDVTINELKIEELEPDTKYFFRLKYIIKEEKEDSVEVVNSKYSSIKSIVVRGEVAATSTSADLSECEIISGTRNSGIIVHLTASLSDRLKSADENYYIVETESYGNSIDWAEPVGEIEKDFEIDTEFVIDQGDGSDDVRECVDRALMNKFALAIKKDDGTYQVISAPMGITNPEAVSENTEAIFTPISKKGLQGVGFDEAADTNSKNTLFNLDLASVVGTGPADGYVAYEYKGKTYYFSECENLVWEFEQMQKGFEQYAQGKTGKNTKICVTLNLLLSYKSANSYLIDSAARSAGHRYYTLNVREEKARETFEAVFLYLGELFGQSDCFVTHWVLGNEVNSSKAWNYQGSLSQDAYMQVYASAFRLLYNGVKAAKTGNNVYISLDNGWTAAPDTYSGKSILDKFAAYAQKENEDMLWSIAYHGYSYPLTRTDFWNDSSNTTFSISTRYISMKNISVLTNYAADLEEKYDKPEGSIRVILSEQGYTASAGQQSQAYALARGYYMAEFNDRVDAFIIRALQDDPDEIKGGLYLGLRTRYEEKRASFYTYEYMDSSIDVFGSKEATSISKGNKTKVEMAQDIICNTNWESIIPGFSRSKLAGMY